nr:MAG TPA: hypothetical protein [Bacteriophage sp.]DAR18274.1 MAG TPA: hypothetical protein [Bacteriophage sp.]
MRRPRSRFRRRVLGPCRSAVRAPRRMDCPAAFR